MQPRRQVLDCLHHMNWSYELTTESRKGWWRGRCQLQQLSNSCLLLPQWVKGIMLWWLYYILRVGPHVTLVSLPLSDTRCLSIVELLHSVAEPITVYRHCTVTHGMLDAHSVVSGWILPPHLGGIIFPLSQIWRKLHPLLPVDTPVG